MMPPVWVIRWKSVMVSFPNFPNSGMISATGLCSLSIPRSTRPRTSTVVNGLHADMVTKTESDVRRRPVAFSA